MNPEPVRKAVPGFFVQEDVTVLYWLHSFSNDFQILSLIEFDFFLLLALFLYLRMI